MTYALFGLGAVGFCAAVCLLNGHHYKQDAGTLCLCISAAMMALATILWSIP